MAKIDHLVVGVSSLDSAAARFWNEFGLEAQPGGTHGDAGTAMLTVPVGDDQYFELLAVTNPESRHPVPVWLAKQVADGDRLLSLAIAPDDFDATANRLGEPVFELDRMSDDGRKISWRLTGMLGQLTDEVLPFFVETIAGSEWRCGWRQPAHRTEPYGIVEVEFGGDPAVVRNRLDEPGLPVRTVPGRSGVAAVVLRTDTGEMALRF